MKTGKLLVAVTLLTLGAPAVADDLEDELKRIRERAIAEEGMVAIAYYALTDYAEAQGRIDACNLTLGRPDFDTMAEEYGAWAKPGIMNWVSGDQSDAADDIGNAARLAYSVAKLNPDCSPLMQSAYRMGADSYLSIFERALKGPPN